VPEGYGLLLMQDGAITGFVAEAGGYEWRSDDIRTRSRSSPATVSSAR
jgi:hypothetical protein